MLLLNRKILVLFQQQKKTSNGHQVLANIAQEENQCPVQPKLRTYPLSMMRDQQRSFNSRWYTEFPFIKYSVQNDAVYCFPCPFFPSLSHKAETTFTFKGMRDWKKKIQSKLEKHSRSDCHKHSMSLWAGYKQARNHGSVSDHLSHERAKTVQENRQYLKSICQIAVLCARQDIGLRGHREHEGSSNGKFPRNS